MGYLIEILHFLSTLFMVMIPNANTTIYQYLSSPPPPKERGAIEVYSTCIWYNFVLKEVIKKIFG
jgi:hypothetical protein